MITCGRSYGIPSSSSTSRVVFPVRRLTTRWSRPGQPEVTFGAILALAGRAAHLEAVRLPGNVASQLRYHHPRETVRGGDCDA